MYCKYNDHLVNPYVVVAFVSYLSQALSMNNAINIPDKTS